MESGVIDKLSALHVPVLFVDYEIAPAKDTAPSIDLLGKVLNRESRGQSLYRLLSSAAAVDSPEDRDHHAEGQRLRGSAGRQQRRLLLYPRPQRLGRAGGGGRGEQYRFAAAAGRLRVRFAGENHQHEARRPRIMTGSKRGNSQCCPLGYAVKPEAVKARGADAAGAAWGQPDPGGTGKAGLWRLSPLL